MHVPSLDPNCKAVRELFSNTASCERMSVGAPCIQYTFELSRGRTAKVLARSLGPDVQVARLAITLLVQCFAVGEPKESTARCSYCREDGIAAAV